MKICHHIDSTTKRARFFCPVHDCGKSFFHATHFIKHLSEHDIEIGIYMQAINCAIQIIIPL